MDMVTNIEYIYAKIWGHCTDPLQNIIKNLDEFTVNHKEQDAIWILKNLNIFSTGVDSIPMASNHGNRYMTLLALV